LARWLREDILSVAGPESAIRRELYDFVAAELGTFSRRASARGSPWTIPSGTCAIVGGLPQPASTE
jgi:hypothetical protein